MNTKDSLLAEIARLEAKESELHIRMGQVKDAREQANRLKFIEQSQAYTERIEELSDELQDCRRAQKAIRSEIEHS